MDVKVTRFVTLYDNNCRKRHIHRRVKGKVIDFSLQLEIVVENRWQPIVRYDTAHGFAHRDIVHPDGRTEKVALNISDLNEALTFADKDLEMNWETYRHRFFKEVGEHD